MLYFQVVADPPGDHQVGCGGNGDRIHRHDSVRDALFSAAQTAALAPRKEVPSLISGTSSQSVEGQRHPLDPPPPHSITGGGWANLTF